MIQFVSGYALGFVSGLALKPLPRVRRTVGLALSTAIAGLDLMHQAIVGEESRFRQMLDQLETTNASVHAEQQRSVPRPVRERRAA